MQNTLLEFYRYPEEMFASLTPQETANVPLDLHIRSSLPFAPGTSELIDYLRKERYAAKGHNGSRVFTSHATVMQLYYCVRPFLGVPVRKYLQRIFLSDWRSLTFPQWPVDTTVDDILRQWLTLWMRATKRKTVPFIWFWPRGASSAVVMTHDVETVDGLRRIPDLLDLDGSADIKASYQLVPEKRYAVSGSLRATIVDSGCEINIQDLNHDGRLFSCEAMFLRRAAAINSYLKQYGAQGFRSGSLFRNVDWYGALGASYDMSIPNVAHLEPQRGGCCTVFPFFIGKILELPLTTIQDYSLFHILGEYSIDQWKEQLSLIHQKHGLATFLVHPDYLNSSKAIRVYRNLLAHLSSLRADRGAWIALPKEVNHWWRRRSRMNLVSERGAWRVVGNGHEEAQVAYATVVDGQLRYHIDKRS